MASERYASAPRVRSLVKFQGWSIFRGGKAGMRDHGKDDPTESIESGSGLKHH